MDRAIIQSAPLGIMRGRGPMTAAMNALADTAAPDATLADLGHLQEVITAKVAGNSLRYGLRTGMPWGEIGRAAWRESEYSLGAAGALDNNRSGGVGITEEDRYAH